MNILILVIGLSSASFLTGFYLRDMAKAKPTHFYNYEMFPENYRSVVELNPYGVSVEETEQFKRVTVFHSGVCVATFTRTIKMNTNKEK